MPAGQPVARHLHLRAHDLLLATNRETSGDAYRRLREAFERLAGTRITTNLVAGAHEITRGFGLIEDWEIVRKTRGGRMIQVRVTLSEWLYRAIMAKSVLTLNRDYFGLRRPLERRLYELARKHCGRQPAWQISLEVLQKKAGSASPRRVFAMASRLWPNAVPISLAMASTSVSSYGDHSRGPPASWTDNTPRMPFATRASEPG